MLNVCHLASIHSFKYTTEPHAPVRLMYHYRRKQSSGFKCWATGEPKARMLRVRLRRHALPSCPAQRQVSIRAPRLVAGRVVPHSSKCLPERGVERVFGRRYGSLSVDNSVDKRMFQSTPGPIHDSRIFTW